MPSYKKYTTEQYTSFLKNRLDNNFGFSDEALADWFMAQPGAKPVINSYGVNKSNLLSTYIPKIKEYQGSAFFFLCYTVTEGGGAGNWINHYGSDTGSNGLQCLIDDLEYCADINNKYPGFPVAMTAPEVAGRPPQENINQAQDVYNNVGQSTFGAIIMPSTMAGNAWVFAEQWCLQNQGTSAPSVYFGNPYNQFIATIQSTGADPFSGEGGGAGTPGNNAPTQTTPTVDTSELLSSITALLKVIKEQMDLLKEASNSNVYPNNSNAGYFMFNKYYKLTKMFNLTRVTLSRQLLDDILKALTNAVNDVQGKADNLQASNKNENVDTSDPNPPETPTELSQYIDNAIAHMKHLQDAGFTYSMDNRWGSSSRDCSSAVSEAYKLGNGNTVSMDSTTLPNAGFEKVVNNPYMAGGWSAQRGDVFILYPNGSSPSASGGAAGHTGIFIDNVNIIHMNYASNGVSIDNCAHVFSNTYGLNIWRPTRAN